MHMAKSSFDTADLNKAESNTNSLIFDERERCSSKRGSNVYLYVPVQLPMMKTPAIAKTIYFNGNFSFNARLTLTLVLPQTLWVLTISRIFRRYQEAQGMLRNLPL